MAFYRKKPDIIIRNGLNLSPRRIEEAILSVPGISDAAVLGLPHPIQGEIPWAMAAGELSEEAVLDALRDKLPKNELPLGIYMTDQLPRTPSGKLDKQAIREVLRKWKA